MSMELPAADIDMQVNTCILCDMEDIEKVFKALSDSSRRALLDSLYASNGQTLGQLCGQHDMTRQAVTQHLAILEAANLVVSLKQGREKLHYLNPIPLHEIYERWIEKFERHRISAVRDLKHILESDKP
jgi:DNA-binding transcriptional ArsR family regulator